VYHGGCAVARQLAVENLFLRKQRSLYLERQMKPRRTKSFISPEVEQLRRRAPSVYAATFVRAPNGRILNLVTPTLSRARIRAATVVLALTALSGGVALAQFGQVGLVGYPYHPLPNIPYDGRFTFVRVRYEPAPGGYWPGRRPSWIHGYPLAERNLMK